MFSAALPVLVRVTFCVALAPTATLLKASAGGLMDICACVAVPVPVNPICSGDPGAFVVIETVPVGLPAEVGVNVVVNELVCPGLRLCGLNPVIV